jgi:hypothetical protein
MYSDRSVMTFREYPAASIFVLSWCTGDCTVPENVGGAVLSDYTASHAARQRSSKKCSVFRFDFYRSSRCAGSHVREIFHEVIGVRFLSTVHV